MWMAMLHYSSAILTHTLRNMAASLKTLSGLAQNKSFLSFGIRYLKTRGNVYTPSNHIIPKDNPEDKIVMAENGDTIVCWHPQQKFPYEYSLPMPIKTTDVNQVLKIQEDDTEELLAFQKEQFKREYLMKMTATTKHRWFPRLGKKFAKKTKPDREFL